jgi:phosphatidylglycerophosphatase A
MTRNFHSAANAVARLIWAGGPVELMWCRRRRRAQTTGWKKELRLIQTRNLELWETAAGDGGVTKDMSDGMNPNRPRAPLWAKLVATFFGTGLLRPGPGSWGSAATVLLWWLMSHCMPVMWQPYAAGSLAVVAMLIGIPAATLVARASGLKDPQFVVIDEVAGQLITLIAVPVSWQSLLLGFILFRGFDIVKPPPVRQLEQLPEGAGIVIDDVAAGLYALAVMQIALRFGILPR